MYNKQTPTARISIFISNSLFYVSVSRLKLFYISSYWNSYSTCVLYPHIIKKLLEFHTYLWFIFCYSVLCGSLTYCLPVPGNLLGTYYGTWCVWSRRHYTISMTELRSLATVCAQARVSVWVWRHRGARVCVRSVGGMYTELSRRSLGRETRASVGRCPALRDLTIDVH